MTFDDYLGQTISVGDRISYVALSGRSGQQVEATVLDVYEQLPYHGAAEIKMQVQPTGRTSRWKQHHGRWDAGLGAHGGYSTDIKPVRIKAEMAVKVP